MGSLPITLVGLVLVHSFARTEGATVVGKGEYAARITPLGYPNILPQFQVRAHCMCGLEYKLYFCICFYIYTSS